MMGFDISDIASFMISPVVSIINDLSTENMFDEYMFKVSIDNAINILRGKFPLSKFFYGRIILNGDSKSMTSYAFVNLNRLLQSKLQSLGFTMPSKKKINGVYPQVPKEYKTLDSIIQDYFIARVNG
nr:MAG TPA: hypothetical protein [Bacteriophage sp.]